MLCLTACTTLPVSDTTSVVSAIFTSWDMTVLLQSYLVPNVGSLSSTDLDPLFIKPLFHSGHLFGERAGIVFLEDLPSDM